MGSANLFSALNLMVTAEGSDHGDVGHFNKTNNNNNYTHKQKHNDPS
jgi:hypothetical protein